MNVPVAALPFCRTQSPLGVGIETMYALERILLYAVALTSAVLMFGTESRLKEPESAANSPTQDDPLSFAEGIDETSRGSGVERRAISSGNSNESFVLKDRRGQRRLEITLGSDDQPQILLNDSKGQAVISLRVEDDGHGRISLRHFNQRVKIGPDNRGDLAVVIEGDEREEIRLALSAEGEAKLITKGRSPATVALSSRANGAADIQIHQGSGTGGPLMSVQKNGEAAIGIANSKREYGPVMHLFPDGLGQLTINGPGSASGPTLIRTPDGTSIVSVRYPNGRPAASMIGSPAGASLLAVTNTTGTQQAALRAEQSGKVGIGVTESKDDPKSPPKPLPQPKPPKVPHIELIRHQPPLPKRGPVSSDIALLRLPGSLLD